MLHGNKVPRTSVYAICLMLLLLLLIMHNSFWYDAREYEQLVMHTAALKVYTHWKNVHASAEHPSAAVPNNSRDDNCSEASEKQTLPHSSSHTSTQRPYPRGHTLTKPGHTMHVTERLGCTHAHNTFLQDWHGTRNVLVFHDTQLTFLYNNLPHTTAHRGT